MKPVGESKEASVMNRAARLLTDQTLKAHISLLLKAAGQIELCSWCTTLSPVPDRTVQVCFTLIVTKDQQSLCKGAFHILKSLQSKMWPSVCSILM